MHTRTNTIAEATLKPSPGDRSITTNTGAVHILIIERIFGRFNGLAFDSVSMLLKDTSAAARANGRQK